ncbi:MAG: hypothetical protein OJF50_004753 [Nitrospira sp.]|nr:hypothetical protein [Nitrospira sp.]
MPFKRLQVRSASFVSIPGRLKHDSNLPISLILDRIDSAGRESKEDL